jgi:hypothetical protein
METRRLFRSEELRHQIDCLWTSSPTVVLRFAVDLLPCIVALRSRAGWSNRERNPRPARGRSSL